MSGYQNIGADFEEFDRQRREVDRDLGRDRGPTPTGALSIGYFIDDAEMLPAPARERATISQPPPEASSSSDLGESLRAEFDSDGRQVASTSESRDEQTEILRQLLDQVRTMPAEIVEALRSS